MYSFRQYRRWTACGRRATFTALFAIIMSAPVSAGIIVNVTRAGFPTLRQSDVVRSGAWVPVLVDLELVNQAEFFGSVRVAQRDVDGDECYDTVTVHLREETGGAQRVVLYALANPQAVGNQGRFVVELFDDEGNAVPILTQRDSQEQLAQNQSDVFKAQSAEPSETILDDEILILYVSSGVMGRIQDLLIDGGNGPTYVRTVRLGHISPSELPELWVGLEMVDHIVWEEPQPESLTESQLRALLEWVNQGGSLVIAASRSIGSLKMAGALEEALPVDIGDVINVDNLPMLRKELLEEPETDQDSSAEAEWWELPFPRPVRLTRSTLRAGAQRIFRSAEHDTDVIARKSLGRGQIVFCGISFDDLFSAPGGARPLFEKLLRLPILKEETSVANPHSLFQNVVSAVAFNRRSVSYLLIVSFGSIGYVLFATLGTWTLLGRRGWKRHAWSAFALAGLGGTLASVFAVNSVRGFGGETLHQVTIVDGVAGDSYGLATVYFGLKTAVDKRLDLWLPSDPLGATEPVKSNCFLRPIPVAATFREGSETFADPVDYQLVPASGQIKDVRIRGTLKRLEGRWEGALGGTVTGNVSIRGKDTNARILDGSYLINELGVDLRDCYLIHTARDFDDATDFRSEFIYAYPIGNVAASSRIDLVRQCYKLEGDEPMPRFLEKSRLSVAQTEWGKGITSILGSTGFGMGDGLSVALGEEENAILLLSTIGEYDPSLDSSGIPLSFGGTRTWSRDRARQLDLRRHLRRDTLILIGFADDPGPVRLFRRSGDNPYRPLAPDPEKSWTVYRFRIPVTLLAGDNEDEDELIR